MESCRADVGEVNKYTKDVAAVVVENDMDADNVVVDIVKTVSDYDNDAAAVVVAAETQVKEKDGLAFLILDDYVQEVVIFCWCCCLKQMMQVCSCCCYFVHVVLIARDDASVLSIFRARSFVYLLRCWWCFLLGGIVEKIQVNNSEVSSYNCSSMVVIHKTE
jgi:hypothetical protein